MAEPTIVAADSLRGVRIALSVSTSRDLAQLGLSERHCRLVVAEVGRAIMLAGGTLVYGGNLSSSGYTEILIDEAQKFGSSGPCLELVLPESELEFISKDSLKAVDRRLGETGKLILLSSEGTEIPYKSSPVGRGQASVALTAMRKYVSETSGARVVVGGKLSGFAGSEPGVIEEARLTVEAGKRILAIGGYGGAAGAIARRMKPEFFESWLPRSLPRDADQGRVLSAVDAFYSSWLKRDVGKDFSNSELLRTLAVSHRPGDIATAVVRLLSE